MSVTRRMGPEPIVAGLEQAIREARRRLSPGRVHRLRVQVRRLEAIAAAAPGSRRPSITSSRVLARLARDVGRLRDVDVAQEWVAREAGGESDGPFAGLGVQFKRLRRRRADAARLTLQRAGLDATIGTATAWARAFERSMPAAVSEGAQPLLAPLVNAVQRHAGWTVIPPATIAAAVGNEGVERLHDLRRAAKRCRYAAEALAPHLADHWEARLATLDALHQTLGRLHDILVIHDLVEKVATRGGKPAPMEARRRLGAEWTLWRRRWSELRREPSFFHVVPPPAPAHHG